MYPSADESIDDRANGLDREVVGTRRFTLRLRWLAAAGPGNGDYYPQCPDTPPRTQSRAPMSEKRRGVRCQTGHRGSLLFVLKQRTLGERTSGKNSEASALMQTGTWSNESTLGGRSSISAVLRKKTGARALRSVRGVSSRRAGSWLWRRVAVVMVTLLVCVSDGRVRGAR